MEPPEERPLELDQAARLLRPFDLRPRSAERLPVGTINLVYRVVTDGGVVALRINRGKRPGDLAYEAALLWHLGARRFPTPQPLRTGDGRAFVVDGETQVSVFPWVEGTSLGDQGITVEHAREIGAVLGRLHRAAADFPGRRSGPYTFERIARRLEAVQGEARLAEVVPLLREEVAFLRGARPPLLPLGTIHGDLFPDNVLFRGAALAAVLDFEQASFGRLAYDLAVTLLAWGHLEGALVDERMRALLAGYDSARPLQASEREGLWIELRTAALRFTVTRLTDLFLPGLERPGKDFRDYLARLERLRELGPSGVAAWLA